MEPTPYLELGIGFARSTNQGVDWSPPDFIMIPGFEGVRGFLKDFDNRGVRETSFPSADVDRSSGPNRGRLYVVWANAEQQSAPGSSADIRIAWSTNHGVTWPPSFQRPVTVNVPQNTDQWSPRVNVDNSGGVNVVFYDSRVDPTMNKFTQVYLGRSTDGGWNWSNYQISDSKWIPQQVPGAAHGYAGDYIGITSTDKYVIPCWNDDRTSIHQAYTARFPLLRTTISSPLISGWQMTGIPVIRDDFTNSHVYPNCLVYRYDGTQYVLMQPGDLLTCTTGWWVRSEGVQVINHQGGIVEMMRMTVHPGWNIIGSISSQVSASAVTSDPPEIVKSLFYKFDHGYLETNALVPGAGYWVKVSQEGTLLLDAQFGNGPSPVDEFAGYDSFTITDAEAHQQVVYVRNSELTSFPNIDGEMPPSPPDGFSASFDPGEILKTVNPDSGTVPIAIRVVQGAYPITLNLVINPENGITYDVIPDSGNGMGKSPSSAKISGSGKLEIADQQSTVLRLGVRAAKKASTGEIPLTYSLAQNYPNPFNPTTEIRFGLPDAGNVSLVVYDVLGRKVAELANGYQAAGYHTATWNAAGAASGVYFARFSVTGAGGAVAYTKINKLVLMK